MYKIYNNFKYENIKTIKYKIIIILLIFFALIVPLFTNISIYKIINMKIEIYIIEKYRKKCEKGIILKHNKFNKNANPKISIISAAYNRGPYILRFLRSIQNQLLDEIEIIFIDDYSTDNTHKIIEKCQKEDNRIILIKHNINKGTLISRNDGAIISRGEYLIFPDPDDILSNDILKYCYNKANKENYDMIRFNLYGGKEMGVLNFGEIKTQKVYQPELSYYIFYNKGYLKQTDYSISNKFIKRNIFIKALNSIKNYYLNQNMIVYEDGLINFKLYKFAKSLYYSKKIGYFYLKNNHSITNNFKRDIERTIKNCYLYLKFIFENTKNNQYEKNIASIIYKNVHLEISNISHFEKLTKEYNFYYNVINLYLYNDFIPTLVKEELKNITKLIKKAEKNKYL